MNRHRNDGAPARAESKSAALGKIKRETADQIERLIDLLDWLEGDYDLEPVGDEAEPEEDYEPSLGSLRVHENIDQTGWGLGACDDREGDYDDKEPSLGWGPNGEMGNDQDLEEDAQNLPTINQFREMLRRERHHVQIVKVTIDGKPEAMKVVRL